MIEMAVAGGRNRVLLFVGKPSDLADVREWATECGFTVVDSFSTEVEYVIVTDDVLDGMCSPGDAVLLSLAESAGLQLVSLRNARDFLRSRPGAAGGRSWRHQVSANPAMHGMRIVDTTL
ncbi:hypothetical protein ACFYVR_26185 [Rhodococcus sp. NPDC003318]|uniref:hypothetical protein n=1 Tax=Rhodococcus sp. NPDC003318 TaxID=3364503 RepID=UPI00368DD140